MRQVRVHVLHVRGIQQIHIDSVECEGLIVGQAHRPAGQVRADLGRQDGIVGGVVVGQQGARGTFRQRVLQKSVPIHVVAHGGAAAEGVLGAVHALVAQFGLERGERFARSHFAHDDAGVVFLRVGQDAGQRLQSGFIGILGHGHAHEGAAQGEGAGRAEVRGFPVVAGLFRAMQDCQGRGVDVDYAVLVDGAGAIGEDWLACYFAGGALSRAKRLARALAPARFRPMIAWSATQRPASFAVISSSLAVDGFGNAACGVFSVEEFIEALSDLSVVLQRQSINSTEGAPARFADVLNSFHRNLGIVGVLLRQCAYRPCGARASLQKIGDGGDAPFGHGSLQYGPIRLQCIAVHISDRYVFTRACG